MPGMVERVARALFESIARDVDGPIRPTWEKASNDVRTRLAADARAMIEAMKYDDWDEDAALTASGQERLETVGFICAYDRFLDAILSEKSSS